MKCCCKPGKHIIKLDTMYKKGEEKLEKDMNLDRILRKLREIHLTLKNNFWNKEMRFLNENYKKNVIQIDETEESE